MSSARRSARARAAVVAAVATIACALLAAVTAQAAWTPAPRGRTLAADDLLPASAAEIDAMRSAKRLLPAGSPLAKIESGIQDQAALLVAARDPRRGMLLEDFVATFATPLVPVDESGRLLVRIAGAGADARVAELVALGAEPVAVAPGYGLLEAWVAPEAVNAIAELPWIRLIATPGLPVAETGVQLSEGDAIHRAAQARATFAVDGAGATVGVISDGVTNLAAAQGSLDLPAGVNVGFAGNGDEGTAMLEIVHDLAPGAGLAFYGAGSGSAGMIAAQNWLVGTAGARIVSDDIWLTREPYFQDGPVALNAAALVAGNDVVYFTSAGNRAQRHIPQAFRDGGARTLGILGASRPHDFGGGDVTADVRLRNPSGTGVRHTIVLQWSEPFGAATRDFDLYLVDPTFSNIIALSTNAQNGTQDPVELIDFTYNGPDNVPARIVVDYAGALPAPANITLKIAANGPTFLEYVNPAGSINPHARHPLVYALGAIDQADPGNDTMEAFSSRGAAEMFFPPATRDKPDAAAVDGVAVTGAGGFGSPFFGTSAASPHGAAIAALLRGVLPALTAADIRATLSATAIDIGPAGFDPASGAGRLDALAALASQLNQPPVADAGNDTTAECTGAGAAVVTLDGTRSSDPDGDDLTYAWSAPNITFDDPTSPTPTASFPLGATTVTLLVSDGSLDDTDEVVVTVEDTTPPTVTVTLDPATLWPPNHKLAPVHATVVVADACDGAPVVRLVSATSDEPDDGLGDGDKPFDVQVVGPAELPVDFLLRSERQGSGDGRVYTICYEAEDESGNVGAGCATVTVTHDQPLAAAFLAPAADADVTVDGGWIEVGDGDEALIGLLTGDVPDLGGDAFARVVAADFTTVDGEVDGQPSPTADAMTTGGVIRWYVPGDVLRQALAGAEAPVLYARFERDGQSVLATVPLPIDAATFAAVATAGAARAPVVDAADVAVAAAPEPSAAPVATAAAGVPGAPDRLLLAMANPLPRGGAVRFGVPRAGHVRVSLVAATGRRVALLEDGERGAGWHRVALPARLDPGTYFAVAEIAGERAVAKVVVTR